MIQSICNERKGALASKRLPRYLLFLHPVYSPFFLCNCLQTRMLRSSIFVQNFAPAISRKYNHLANIHCHFFPESSCHAKFFLFTSCFFIFTTLLSPDDAILCTCTSIILTPCTFKETFLHKFLLSSFSVLVATDMLICPKSRACRFNVESFSRLDLEDLRLYMLTDSDRRRR